MTFVCTTEHAWQSFALHQQQDSCLQHITILKDLMTPIMTWKAFKQQQRMPTLQQQHIRRLHFITTRKTLVLKTRTAWRATQLHQQHDRCPHLIQSMGGVISISTARHLSTPFQLLFMCLNCIKRMACIYSASTIAKVCTQHQQYDMHMLHIEIMTGVYASSTKR